MTLEVWYYLSIYGIGALGGLTRINYNGEWLGAWNLLKVACMGGLCGFVVVAILIAWIDWNAWQPVPPVGGLGISAFIGLSGKNSVELIEMVSANIKKRLGPHDDKT